jgi:hypothetical protein
MRKDFWFAQFWVACSLAVLLLMGCGYKKPSQDDLAKVGQLTANSMVVGTGTSGYGTLEEAEEYCLAGQYVHYDGTAHVFRCDTPTPSDKKLTIKGAGKNGSDLTVYCKESNSAIYTCVSEPPAPAKHTVTGELRSSDSVGGGLERWNGKRWEWIPDTPKHPAKAKRSPPDEKSCYNPNHDTFCSN